MVVCCSFPTSLRCNNKVLPYKLPYYEQGLMNTQSIDYGGIYACATRPYSIELWISLSNMLQNLSARLVGTRHMSEMQTSDWLHNVDYSHGPNIHDSTITFEYLRTI